MYHKHTHTVDGVKLTDIYKGDFNTFANDFEISEVDSVDQFIAKTGDNKTLANVDKKGIPVSTSGWIFASRLTIYRLYDRVIEL